MISPDFINTYFQTINSDDAYEAPTRLQIPEGTHLPTVSKWCKEITYKSETNRFGAWWVSLPALARLLSPSAPVIPKIL